MLAGGTEMVAYRRAAAYGEDLMHLDGSVVPSPGNSLRKASHTVTVFIPLRRDTPTRARAICRCVVFVADSLWHVMCLPAGPDRTKGLIHTMGDAYRQ